MASMCFSDKVEKYRATIESACSTLGRDFTNEISLAWKVMCLRLPAIPMASMSPLVEPTNAF